MTYGTLSVFTIHLGLICLFDLFKKIIYILSKLMRSIIICYFVTMILKTLVAELTFTVSKSVHVRATI